MRGAEALLAAGCLEEAEALAVEAVERFPEHVGGYVQRAEVAMRREDWSLAVRYWEAVRAAFPEQASGMLQVARKRLDVKKGGRGGVALSRARRGLSTAGRGGDASRGLGGGGGALGVRYARGFRRRRRVMSVARSR